MSCVSCLNFIPPDALSNSHSMIRTGLNSNASRASLCALVVFHRDAMTGFDARPTRGSNGGGPRPFLGNGCGLAQSRRAASESARPWPGRSPDGVGPAVSDFDRALDQVVKVLEGVFDSLDFGQGASDMHADLEERVSNTDRDAHLRRRANRFASTLLACRGPSKYRFLRHHEPPLPEVQYSPELISVHGAL